MALFGTLLAGIAFLVAFWLQAPLAGAAGASCTRKFALYVGSPVPGLSLKGILRPLSSLRRRAYLRVRPQGTPGRDEPGVSGLRPALPARSGYFLGAMYVSYGLGVQPSCRSPFSRSRPRLAPGACPRHRSPRHCSASRCFCASRASSGCTLISSRPDLRCARPARRAVRSVACLACVAFACGGGSPESRAQQIKESVSSYLQEAYGPDGDLDFAYSLLASKTRDLLAPGLQGDRAGGAPGER